MTRFPRIWLTLTLDEPSECTWCDAAIPAYSTVGCVCTSLENSNVGIVVCPACVQREQERRGEILKAEGASSAIPNE